MKTYLFLMLLLSGTAAFTQSRFTKVEWEVHRRSPLSNGFTVTMKLTTRKGKQIIVQPGENELKWQAFRFESEDLQHFVMGTGRYRISRDLTGSDTIVVTAVSE